MNEGVLSVFRELGKALAERPKVKIEITLKNDRVLSARYDPIFRTITIGGMTFPAGELSLWTKLSWGSEVATIIAKDSDGEAGERTWPR